MPSDRGLSHISIATYYRLFIPALLPENIERVLYLDCDIVVRKNLTPLWEIPLDNLAVGAVNHVVDWNVTATQRLNYPAEAGYFNAGVLLINLKYWRINHVSEKLFDFIAQNRDVIKFHEQDALNGLLYDKCFRISCKWNMMSGFYMKNLKSIHDELNGLVINDYAAFKKEIAAEIPDPAVVHFVSKPKPWDAGCYHPFKKEYYRYLHFTPWKDFQEPKLLNFYLKNPGLIPGYLKKWLIKIKSKELYIRL
jgi:lipopolysaccharide biosynthesis glycosyltransferase